jgi:hypothetical protein
MEWLKVKALSSSPNTTKKKNSTLKLGIVKHKGPALQRLR